MKAYNSDQFQELYNTYLETHHIPASDSLQNALHNLRIAFEEYVAEIDAQAFYEGFHYAHELIKNETNKANAL